MQFFSSKQEVVTRSYDVAGSGFSALPLAQSSFEDSEKINSILKIAALFSAIFIGALAYGVMMMLISLRLNEFVKNEVLISLSSATQIFAGIIFSRFLPILGRKIGLTNTVAFGSLLASTCSFLMYFYVDYFLWTLVIFIYGISAFICGVSRQTIMIDLAPKHLRSLIISLGTMIVSIGNSLGPILINYLNTADSALSFLIATFLYLISIIPLALWVKVSETDIRQEKKISLLHYITTSPKIMFAGFSVNYAISSSNTFLVIYGMRIGLPEDQAATMLSVLLFGTVFSIPIGYLADIINRRLLIMASASAALVCAVLLYFTSNTEQIHILLFITFGFLMGVKLPAVVLINEKYKPTQRLAVNSAFQRVSLFGNIVGIFSTGAIMNLLGPKGLWISIIIILLLFLTFCLLNYVRKIARKEYNIKYFSIFNRKITDEQML